jgi:hypothetical protein
MEKIRSKFTVTSVEEFSYGGKRAKLNAQYSNTPEDNQFAKATPSGQIEITVDNPLTKDYLKPGKSFYVDFIEIHE